MILSRIIQDIRVNPISEVSTFIDHAGRMLSYVEGGHLVPDLTHYARRIAAGEAVRVDIPDVSTTANPPRKNAGK